MPQSEAERRRLEREAAEILRRAGYRDDGLPLGSKNGSRVLARASYNPICPTNPNSDQRLNVVTTPAPVLQSAKPRTIGTITGPDGRPWKIVHDGQDHPRDKHFIYVPIRARDSWSRAREWIFEGPADEVNETEKRLLLTSTYFESWLRRKRPRAAERTIEREMEIAISCIAECSPCLVYRGRNGSYDSRGRVTSTPHSSGRRSPLLATAAACRVSVATVRRVSREMKAFHSSALFRQKVARYDSLPNPTLL